MIRYESQCISCGFPCRYEACRYYKVRVLECDSCHDEADKLYRLDGEELCESCAFGEIGGCGMKFKAKRDIKFSELSGFENYEIIPNGEICEVMIFERSPAIFYNGKAVCDPDSQMAKDCFDEVVE